MMPSSAATKHEVENLTERALSGREGYIALSAEEENRLAERARKGDREAAWTLAMANQNFVRSLAQRYLRPEIDLEDLVAEGMVGLIEAAERFDGARGVKFITYGSWWIKRAILRWLRTFDHPVHVPKYKQHSLHEFKRTRQRLQQELGRTPGLDELCAATGQDVRSVQEHAGLSTPHASVDDEAISDALSALDDVERLVIQRDALLRLDGAMDVLGEREREILTRRFGLDGEEPETLAELGERAGLTKERIRQIEKQACRRLAEAMEAAAADRRRLHAA